MGAFNHVVNGSLPREGEDTRREAMLAAQARSQALHVLILDVLEDNNMTADEVAAEVGEDILSIRPRMTELNQQGKIIKTALRRKNKSGRSAIVWMIAPN